MKKWSIVETLLLMIYPNTLLICSPNWISISLIIPMGPENTVCIAKTYFAEGGHTEPYAAIREESGKYWKSIFDESGRIWAEIQALQRQREELGLATRFSLYFERCLHLFQLYIAERLIASDGVSGSA